MDEENKKVKNLKEQNKEKQPKNSKEDESYCINMDKGSPLNPNITNQHIEEVLPEVIEEIMTNKLTDSALDQIERPEEPYKDITQTFLDAKIVAGQVIADGVSLQQLSAGLKNIIKKCDFEDVTVEEIPAKVILMRKNYNIIVPDGNPTDPDFKLGFSL
jgi:hypothetical protein